MATSARARSPTHGRCTAAAAATADDADADGDLRELLGQLCADLLAPTASSADRRGALRSLAALAERFPRVRRSLGRLLSGRRLDPPAAAATATAAARASRPLLAELAARCLYARETAREALALLAALAHGHAANQRRIARWVPAVRLAVAGAGGETRRADELLVLTVPEPLRAAWRQWRRRQRSLLAPSPAGESRRAPTGSPPSAAGVPAPCYCDACLGAEQLLATWCQHFGDLARWTADAGAAQARPALSFAAFLRAELADYELRSCRGLAGEALGSGPPAAAACRIYYLVPRDQAARPAEFDPARHASAIRVAAEPWDAAAQPRRDALAAGDADRAPADASDPLAGLDQVLLFDGRVAVGACACGAPRRGSALAALSATIGRNCGGGRGASVLCGDLRTPTAVDSARAALGERARAVAGLVLPFLGSEELAALAGLGSLLEQGEAEPSAAELEEARPMEAQATVSARLSTQALRIDLAVGGDGSGLEPSARALFTADVPSSAVCAALAAPGARLALVGLSDDDVRSILSRCRVCWSASHGQDRDGDGLLDGSPIVLRPHRVVGSGDEGVRTARRTAESKIAADARRPGKQVPGRSLARPLPGLPDETAALLKHILEAADGGESAASSDRAAVSLLTQLSAAIASCNARVRQLSTPRQGVAGSVRLAATARCRACRDELIQLCKQVKLAIAQAPASEPELSAAAAGGAVGLLAARRRPSRVQSAVRAGIRSVLARSERFDAWEAPDERVTRLRLDRGAWASGVPDFEFYQEGDARAAANARRQRELSLKLQRQRRIG